MSLLPLSTSWFSAYGPELLAGAMALTWAWASGCSASKPAAQPEPPPVKAGASDDPTIPYERYTLPNGLTVLLHQDARLPVVAVDLWYRVGSFNEPPGRTGFAHLFEHLMFQGSRHVPDDGHFRLLEQAGASEINGTTDFDRTNYFETVPREELPLAVWLESDRMGFLADTLTARKLDNQRAVVKNEKRQSYDGAPYGLAYLALYRALFPEGHPYRYTPIGKFEDLDAASLEDVRNFFRTYYAPANATLAIAGDFEVAPTKALILKAFGSIPSGTKVAAPAVVTPPLKGEVRQVVEEPVAPLPKVTMAWLSPPFLAPGDADLDVLSTILTAGKGSRLYQALVDKTQMAVSVEAHQHSLALTSVFEVDATAAPGHSLEEVEAALDAALEDLAANGPTLEEVTRARRRIELGMLRGLEKMGSLGGRAEILQTYLHAAGDPGYLGKHLEAYRAVTPESVRDIVRRVLRKDARVVQHAVPRAPGVAAVDTPPELPPEKAVGDSPKLEPADPWRAAPPEPLSGGTLVLPVPERAVLDNGLTVLCVPQRSLPMVALTLVNRAGAAQDAPGMEGRSSLAAQMLTEGMEGGDAAAQANAFAELGTDVSSAGGLEASTVGTVVHKRHVDEAVRLLGRMVASPTLDAAAFERLRTRMVTHLDERLHDPMGVAMHISSKVAVGENHPYAHPREGTLGGLKGVTLDGIKAFHAQQWVAGRMALVVAGDISLADAVELARKHLGALPRGEPPAAAPPAVPVEARPSLWAVDLPKAPQAVVMAGRPALGAHDPDVPSLTLLNAVLGGNFSSRLNMNLREDKGITYGAFSYAQPMRSGGTMTAAAPVQADSVGLARREMLKEIAGLVSAPVTPEELTLAKQSNSRSLPADFEGLASTAGAMARLYALDLPLDHWARLPGKFDAVTLEDQARLAKQLLVPAQMQVLLVGDRRLLEKALAEDQVSAVTWLDVEGNPLPAPAPEPAKPAKKPKKK